MPRDLLAETLQKQPRDLLAQPASPLHSGAEFISQRDPGIDYKTGVRDFAFRAGFSSMDNEPEKARFLDDSVGKGAWHQDSFGAYVVKPEGLKRLGIESDKPRAIDEQTASRYDIADVAGDLPAIAGATALPLAASGAGLPAALGLSALGGAGGKALSEIVKNIRGQQVKSPGEVASTLGKEAALAAGGEVGGRALGWMGMKAIGPHAAKMTPEKAALARSAADQGFKVRAGSVTDAPLLGRWEGMVRQIFGDLYETQNVKAANQGLARLGAMAGKGVPKETAGEAVVSSIKAQRVRFSEIMGARYANVDRLAGDVPIVPTAPLKQQAETLLSQLAKTKEGKVIGGKDSLLRDVLNMGDSITARQAQRLRTMFREASESPDLIPDVSMHDARVLKRSIEEAFDLAKSSGGASREAIEALRAADSAYASGIRQFDKPIIRAITKDASKGTVDADMVVDYIIKPGRIVRLRQVKALVKPEQWAKVKSAHAQELLSDVVKGTDDPLKTFFDGKGFRDELNKFGRETLEEIHGKEWTDAAYKYSEALMLANKRMKLSGGIVAANIALHPLMNLPKLVWLRALAKFMENPGTFKWLTEGITLGPNTKAGAAALTMLTTKAATMASDETGSAAFTLTEPQ